MATKNYLDYTGLTTYDGLIKDYIGDNTGDSKNVTWEEYSQLPESEKKNSNIAYYITGVPDEESKKGYLGTASGELCTFPDGSDLPMPKLEVAIEPVQDLHGYDSPWVGGSGKNKLKVTATTTTKSGVTFTVKEDGTIVVTGTKSSSSTTRIWFDIAFNISFSEDVILNGCPSDGGNNAYKMAGFLGDTGTGDYNDIGSGVTIPADTMLKTLSIGIAQQGNINLVFKPMIRLASVSDATFAPYSNICPISGWDEVDVNVSGKNLVESTLVNTTINTNGEINVSGGSSTFDMHIAKIIKGETYTIQSDESPNVNQKLVGGFFYDMPQLGSISYNNSRLANTPATFTAPIDGYVAFRTSHNYAFAQIEFGTTATTYEPYNGTTYTIDLDGTRYGGKVDLVSGVMTVTHGYVDLGTVNWDKYTSSAKTYFRTSAQLADAKKSDSPSTTHNLMCSDYKEDTWSHVIDGSGYDGNICIGWNNNAYIGIYDSRYVDVSTSDFKTAMNGVQLVYELATPLTIQLTPTVVKSLRGMNNVTTDVGGLIQLEYWRSGNVQLRMNDYVIAGGNTVAYADVAENIIQTPISTDSEYRILFSGSDDNTTKADSVGKNGGLLYNPNKNAITLGTRTSSSVTGGGSFVLGGNNTASGNGSFIHGVGCTASGNVSHAIGAGSVASGNVSYAQGSGVTASGDISHAEGTNTEASNDNAHAEGYHSLASGPVSHAEGSHTVASGNISHAEGIGTIAQRAFNHVFGKYNVADTGGASTIGSGTYIEIVGNGTDDTTGRSNARTLDWSGNETLAGNLVLGGTNSDITLSGSGNTWDGTNTSLKAAIAAASGGGSISDFTPPTTQAAGVHGLVPAPAILEDADNKLFLLSDGTWEFKGHYEDTQMKEENVPLNFYIDGNGDSVVVETWKPQNKVVEADLDAGGISYDLLSNDNYQTQRGLTPNEYISEFTNKNIHLEVESGDAYAINKYHIPTGENSVSMDIDAGDINLSSTWDGTNTSLKDAITALSNRITALGG